MCRDKFYFSLASYMSLKGRMSRNQRVVCWFSNQRKRKGVSIKYTQLRL